MPITTTSPRIISLRFISNKFPRLLAEREIIANAFYLSGFLPEPNAKIQILFVIKCCNVKKMQKFILD
jgi:hypothetical protein